MTLTDRRVLMPVDEIVEWQKDGQEFKEKFSCYDKNGYENVYRESDIKEAIDELKSKIADLKINVEENGITTEIDLDEPFYREMIEKKIKDVMGDL